MGIASAEDRRKAATPRGKEILETYRAKRATGEGTARFCTEAMFDECCGWCVRIVDEEIANVNDKKSSA